MTLDGEPVSAYTHGIRYFKTADGTSGAGFSPNQIYEEVWKDNPFGTENTVAVHIRHLREKVEYNPAGAALSEKSSGGVAIKSEINETEKEGVDMKKWKNSPAAKIIAWIILTICAVGCVASARAYAMAMTGEGIYTETEEQVKERMIGEEADMQFLL